MHVVRRLKARFTKMHSAGRVLARRGLAASTLGFSCYKSQDATSEANASTDQLGSSRRAASGRPDPLQLKWRQEGQDPSTASQGKTGNTTINIYNTANAALAVVILLRQPVLPEERTGSCVSSGIRLPA